ncbi:hypothetical protein HOH30_03405, partial [Candidatus Woesearchaeota archaeon]|nr:hypothetical protein [Candidatus Woesearchaeota archaeon]
MEINKRSVIALFTVLICSLLVYFVVAGSLLDEPIIGTNITNNSNLSGTITLNVTNTSELWTVNGTNNNDIVNVTFFWMNVSNSSGGEPDGTYGYNTTIYNTT